MRFIRFYDCKVHPQDMGATEVERFLSCLASEGHVSAATQKQNLNALVFLYRQVLDIDLLQLQCHAPNLAKLGPVAGD